MVRFKAFEIVATLYGNTYRIAKIRFADDGSIYVFFPGFARTDGIVSRMIHRGGIIGSSQVDLTENGKVTSHLVKYAHHTDGEAHFSQDGKINTIIRRKSVPLSKHRGHLFTIQAQKIEGFPKLKSSRKAQLTFNLPESTRSLKITGWRHRLEDLMVPDDVSPRSKLRGIQTSDGTTRTGLFVLPPETNPFKDVVLFLAGEEQTWLNKEKNAQFIFVGAFDEKSIAGNYSLDTEFLAFAYPCSDFKKLKERIGCIDLK